MRRLASINSPGDLCHSGAFSFERRDSVIPEKQCSADAPKVVICVAGTRPEAIKMAPVILTLRERPEFLVYTLATGQHSDMLDQAFAHFHIEPDHNLRVMREGQSLDYITSRVVEESGKLFDAVRPSMVLVHGDTTTTFAAALSSFYRHIPVGHVEAGLRSRRMDIPFPEEANRILADRLSSLLFAPTPNARLNLIREGFSEDSITITGNTVIDALVWTIEHGVESRHDSALPGNDSPFIVFTAHRRESWGEPLIGMCNAIRRILEAHREFFVLIPLHKNPSVRDSIRRELGKHPRVVFSEPLDYGSFVNAMRHCSLILSDSGGIQEEAAALGKPVLVLRDVSERPEAMLEGTATLAGTSPEEIFNAADTILSGVRFPEEVHRKIRNNPFGDGNASQKIADVIVKYFNDRS